VIQLKHRDGTTIDLDGITDGQARAMTVALGKGWAFGTVQPVPTFTPIEATPPPARKPRAPKAEPSPEVLRAVLEYFAPGITATKRKHVDDTGMATDTSSDAIDFLAKRGDLVCKGKTYSAKVPADKVAT